MTTDDGSCRNNSTAGTTAHDIHARDVNVKAKKGAKMRFDLEGVQKPARKGGAKTLPRATGIEKPKTTSGEYKIAAAARAARRIETQIAREAAKEAAFTDAIVTGMLR